MVDLDTDILIIGAGMSGLGLAAMPAQAAAGFDPAASQVSGVDRFDTAARIATAAFPGGAQTVVVANGDRAIDAQAGAYAAGLNKAPILLTQKSSVPAFTVDAIEVSDDEVDTELPNLRARFGTLTGVDRPAQDGDFVSIDLSATVDGEDVEEAKTEGLSHEIGSGNLIEGLDDAIKGYPAEEQPAGCWWLPQRYGGSAPSLAEAAELDAKERAERARRRTPPG